MSQTVDSRMCDEEEEEGEDIPITIDFDSNMDGSKRKRGGNEGKEEDFWEKSLKNVTCKRLKDFDKVKVEFEITPEDAKRIYEEEMEKKRREKERPGIGGREIDPKKFISDNDYEIIRKETDYLVNTPLEEKVPWKMNVWEVIQTTKIPDYLKQQILKGEKDYINGDEYIWPGVKCCAMVSDPIKLK